MAGRDPRCGAAPRWLLAAEPSRRSTLPALRREPVVDRPPPTSPLTVGRRACRLFAADDRLRCAPGGAVAAAVFGARVYASGLLSHALRDRLRTACDLYQQGLVGKLLLFGGPGDGKVSKPEVMKRAAMQWGVHERDLLLDPAGLDTQATVDNTVLLFRQLGMKRILAVSHAYHLPRIEMTYERAGWTVHTVPARETILLLKMPLRRAREVVALWVYYLRPLWP
ncbi:MAG: hypothetical protein COZ06_11340 [Armatimonadetes bacterium CG_4_10_14_3_um_filter_66_18]|nr:MAG: hypothetical protein COS65_20010 [Armatimonadetes bacterium CG06_land_8_20_14_3_00_66_21]PIX49984.1 MAG: hypothetical protein COZ57_01270 [Armatimonadetes bacterium CG_4_8_14_3_um_filter_66_20]PIY50051.1 MAG: hypothetical protein COZ06_11340 [Armatimonadetes bacterium CG_4_10_14_3_um_filter_66_18]PIZ30647.1 MAG: hypothetical protein COY42_33625 [Armatimonadetes bacterium CG_4_10_14_0_8_um_filter_66_14]